MNRKAALFATLTASALTVGLTAGVASASGGVDRTSCTSKTVKIDTDTGWDCFGPGSGAVELYSVGAVYAQGYHIQFLVNGTWHSLSPGNDWYPPVTEPTVNITDIDVYS